MTFLGRKMVLSVDSHVGAKRRLAYESVSNAVALLDGEYRGHRLRSEEAAVLSSLGGIVIRPGVSRQEHGVFYFGVDDIDPRNSNSTDPVWIASCILHDAVHASLWRQGTDYNSEDLPSQVQEAFLRRHGRKLAADSVKGFRLDPEAQYARRRQIRP